MKNVGGIDTPFTDAVVSSPGPRDTPPGSTVDGMDGIRDGQKGTPGIMAEVTFVSEPDGGSNPGTGLTGIKGSEPRS